MTYRIRCLSVLTAVLAPALVCAQTAPKLDESLRETVAAGCVGSRPVIIRTKPGYRDGLRASLTAHGDQVTGEFPALDALVAQVHCDDLPTLAGFTSTRSVSTNGPVGLQSFPSLGGSVPGLTDAQAAITAAQAALGTARATAKSAQLAVRAAESAAADAQAQLGLAQKAVKAATKLPGPAQPLALAAATAKVAAAQITVTAAQAALTSARTTATRAQAAALAAEDALVAAQTALVSAAAQVVSRDREGRAAHALKRPFFATLPVSSETATTETQIEADGGDAAGGQTAWGQPAGGQATGGSVGVAIIDSGLEPGVDFGDRITFFYDFTQGDIRAVPPSDGYGHGTHVAGLIASQYVGVAPTARLIGLKVLNEKGRGTTDTVVRAIEFAITNKALLGIDVLNLSLGHPIFEPAATDPLVQAVEHATRAGIVVVVSAGNFGMNPKTGQPGYAGIASPGNAPSGVSVGAVRTFNTVSRLDDRIAPYSSRGPTWYDGFVKPDVVAPGDNLLSVAAVNSTLRLAQEKRGNTGDYMRLSGTSMAAAVASGVVAVVLQANHGLTPNTVKAVLEYSAIPVTDDTGTPANALIQGAGQIELPGAVAYARAITPTAPVGSAWLATPVTPATTIGGQTYPWAQSILWGPRRLAGATLLAEQRPGWGLAIVWGEGVGADDDNIVWGNHVADLDTVVWGNAFDAGDQLVWGHNLVWHKTGPILWGTLFDGLDNIVWGNLFAQDDNIVWGNNIMWGEGLIGMTVDGANIVWGNALGDLDNIVWGNLADDNIVWGNLFDDNIVWGNALDDLDNIVWGNALSAGDVLVEGPSADLGTVTWSGGIVRSGNSRGRRSVAKEGVN